MTARQAWLRILALTPFERLAESARELAPLPPFEILSGPEIGLAMVRGRTGGDGTPFNLGEMTVTKCRLRVTLADARTYDGFACVAGRAPQHAELVALYDALLQSTRWHDVVRERVIVSAERLLVEKRIRSAQRRAATKAEFVTVVRSGEA